MAGKFKMQLRGDKEIQRVLKKAPLPVEAQERLIREGLTVIRTEARSRAPGAAAPPITIHIDREGKRLLGRVKVADRTNKGFRYLWALDASKKIKGKTGRYRHRTGPRAGKLTKSWFRGSKTGARKRLKASFEREAAAHLRAIAAARLH